MTPSHGWFCWEGVGFTMTMALGESDINPYTLQRENSARGSWENLDSMKGNLAEKPQKQSCVCWYSFKATASTRWNFPLHQSIHPSSQYIHIYIYIYIVYIYIYILNINIINIYPIIRSQHLHYVSILFQLRHEQIAAFQRKSAGKSLAVSFWWYPVYPNRFPLYPHSVPMHHQLCWLPSGKPI